MIERLPSRLLRLEGLAVLAGVAPGVVGVLAGSELAMQVALIWLAHIGVDRLLGYGLKYPTGFRDMHLQRV